MLSTRTTTGRRSFRGIDCAAGAGVVASIIAIAGCSGDAHDEGSQLARPWLASAAVADEDAAARERHPVYINRPAGPPRVATGMLDDLGNPVTVSCMSCHSTQTPNFAARTGEDLTHFHQGLHMAHGGLSCLSCHNADDYNTLRLVDGTPLEYPDVMTLCAQCHAPQHRDYLNGAHGGMSGYWDLSRGPRQRLNCIDCHDAHAPAFPHMQPTFKPRDRFLDPPKKGGGH